MRGFEELRRTICARALPAEPPPEARALAEAVAHVGGASVLGIVFFGSRKSQAGPDPWSAYDLFVLTRGYRDFYESLGAAGILHRRAWLGAALNVVLPPNQVSIKVPAGPDADVRHAKCAVISLDALVHETSERRHDHFCSGRLFQPTEILFARDEANRERILDALLSAHVLTYSWVRPWLPERFDVEAYCRTLLRVSMGWEIRPEPEGRAAMLWEAQQEALCEVYALLLAELAAAGELQAHPDASFSLTRPVGWWERWRSEAYFRWSLVRATVRWLKYIVTFEGWMPYIIRKAERHTGQEIVLTPRERRWPWIFLWGRFFRYLRDKDRMKGGPR